MALDLSKRERKLKPRNPKQASERSDNKIWTVTNPSTVADHQGHHIQVKATTDPEKSMITVQEVKMLKEGS